jgi:hypothetical protein
MVDGKRSLSDRLKGMGFMKRREERELRAQLAAAESSTTVAPKEAGAPTVDGVRVVSGPLIVVEGGTGGSVLGAGRSGRRSFGRFNKVVERDFAVAVSQATSGEPTADEKLRQDAAAQYQRWKLKNVSSALSGTSLSKGILKGSKSKQSRHRDKMSKLLRASAEDMMRSDVAPDEDAGLTVNEAGGNESGNEFAEITDASDVPNGPSPGAHDTGLRDTSNGVKLPIYTRESMKSARVRQSPSPLLDSGGGDANFTSRPFKKPKL